MNNRQTDKQEKLFCGDATIRAVYDDTDGDGDHKLEIATQALRKQASSTQFFTDVTTDAV